MRRRKEKEREKDLYAATDVSIRDKSGMLSFLSFLPSYSRLLSLFCSTSVIVVCTLVHASFFFLSLSLFFVFHIYKIEECLFLLINIVFFNH
jgi:hypothetical protein